MQACISAMGESNGSEQEPSPQTPLSSMRRANGLHQGLSMSTLTWAFTPSPGVAAHRDGNEATAPVTAEVWAEHSIWPQDPGFTRALAGGVTTMQILPGSANLFGGRGVTLKNVPSISYQAMKFPNAPHGLKMACGENPKRVYGNRNQAPSTRMGNVAAYRNAWIKAQRYVDDWDRYERAVAEAGGKKG
jgi:imidazolonepropionase-like amidohydrolase